MNKLSLWLATFTLVCTPPVFANRDQCSDAVTKELERLGMGTYLQPIDSVQRSENTGLRFGNPTEFTRFDQVVGITDLFSVKRMVYVRGSSVVFGGTEKKEIILNQKCEVESVKIVLNSTSIDISSRLCHAISDAKKVARTRDEFVLFATRAAAGSYWSKSPFLVDVVVGQCELYAGQLAR